MTSLQSRKERSSTDAAPRLKPKRNIRYTLRKSVIPHTLLIALGIVFLFPFAWLISTSLKTPDEIFKIPPDFIPSEPQWQNYTNALEAIPFMRYVGNTLIICAVNIVGQLLSAPLVAYSIAKIPWRGRNVIFMIIVATMILPPQVTMIPVYIIFSKLGWVNTYLPLTIGSFFGSAFFIFLLRQFFLGIPNELSEAARIDGANELRIYGQIMMPLLKPPLATIVLFTFVSSWTDFLGPLIYLNDAEKWTITVGLQGFLQDHGAQWELLMAAAAIFTIPMVVLYFFGQKFFMKAGSTMTGFK